GSTQLFYSEERIFDPNPHKPPAAVERENTSRVPAGGLCPLRDSACLCVFVRNLERRRARRRPVRPNHSPAGASPSPAASSNQASTGPDSLIVIGWPKRS